MKIVIQRVQNASVAVDGKIVGEIERGILIFVGVMKGDKRENAEFLAKKAVKFRIFHDDQRRMNKSLLDIGGEALVISQFTLAADGRKGNRPSFDNAAPPEEACILYQEFVQLLQNLGISTKTGIFGAYMAVNIANDGPVTFVLEHSSR